MSDTYDGAVVFVEGVHYPVGDDGHPNLDRPLRWVDGSTYRDADESDALHNDVHHVNRVELAFDTGDGSETLEVTPEEAEQLKATLDEIRNGGQ